MITPFDVIPVGNEPHHSCQLYANKLQTTQSELWTEQEMLSNNEHFNSIFGYNKIMLCFVIE